ncbi:hypothetical protein GGI09_002853 [Coemansia sp. S100]|nr:hypothetical protein GGI14_000892 [Coemansia sp. S680]KAJ2097416.1 hypothetical protein GGI16_004566 [Coemansia sp. S142-1]KAJ2099311.1 hypothetical protein GGI09_002853 [Coemansia sp. S100]
MMDEQAAEFYDHVNDSQALGASIIESDIKVRNTYVNRICRVLTVQLLLNSLLLRGILWFEFVVLDYSNSWLLIFSLILNSIFSMVGLWDMRRSQVASAGFLTLFTCTSAYLINLLVWYFTDIVPMQACFITTVYFAVITVFTMQTKVDVMNKWAINAYGGCTGFIAGLLHIVEPYWSFSRFAIAFVLATVLCFYFAFGIVRSMSLLNAETKPTVSLAVAVTMIYPFIHFTGIGLEDFGY